VKSSRLIAAFLLIVTWSGLLLSQQPATVPSGVVPQLVNFSGKAVDAQGKTISGIAGVTVAIYQQTTEQMKEKQVRLVEAAASRGSTK
jgi:hypothetical protein